MNRIWADGADYESYVGRWSRAIAVDFVAWLEPVGGLTWLDLGCGTGALTTAILAGAEPAAVLGVDPSPEFVAHARAATSDGRAQFVTGDAQALPLGEDVVDAVVSGLVLNFVPDPAAALRECIRVARPGATVAAYVWDYAEGMEPIRAFWDAAIELDPAVGELDEARRFGLCRPGALRELFAAAGLLAATDRAIERSARFTSFDDYWTPFLSGTGPAPAYCAALPDEQREALRALLAERLPAEADGAITLMIRAFAVRSST